MSKKETRIITPGAPYPDEVISDEQRHRCNILAHEGMAAMIVEDQMWEEFVEGRVSALELEHAFKTGCEAKARYIEACFEACGKEI